MKKEDFKNVPIAGYTAYYLEPGIPIEKESEITKIPITLKSKIIKPELKDKFLERFEKTGIPMKQEIEDFINTNKKTNE